AEAASRLSRRSSESLIWLSSSAHEDTGSSGSRRAAASEAAGPWAGLRKSGEDAGLRKSAPGPGCFRKSGAESADGPSAGLRMSEVSSRRSGVRVAFMHSPSAASRLSVTRGGRTLPATAQGFVDRDQASHGVGSADCKLVLGLELSAFRIKDFQKVDDPALIPGARQAGGRGTGPGGIVGVPQVVTCTSMSYQGILGVLEGQEHRLLVGDEVDIRLGMRRGDPGADPAEVESRPGDAGSNLIAASTGGPQGARVIGHIAEVACERDLRKQVADGDADPGGVRREVPFGHPDIGAPAEQGGRIANCGELRQVGQRLLRAEQCGQRIGVTSCQDAQAMDRAGDRGLQGRNGREGRAQLRLRTGGVELGAASGTEALGGDAQTLALVLYIATGNRKLVLRAP